MNSLNQHAEVVTEHLTEHLVELSDITLAPYRITELALDHGEGGLDVRPLVVMV